MLSDDPSRRGFTGAVLGAVALIALASLASRFLAAPPADQLAASPAYATCLLLGATVRWLHLRRKFSALALVGAGGMAALAGWKILGAIGGYAAETPVLPLGASTGAGLLSLALVTLFFPRRSRAESVSWWLAGMANAVGIGMFFSSALAGAGGDHPFGFAPFLATAQLLLGASVLLAERERPPFPLLFARTAAGKFVRRALAGIVLIPVASAATVFVFFTTRETALIGGFSTLAGVLAFGGFILVTVLAEKFAAGLPPAGAAAEAPQNLRAELADQEARFHALAAQHERELREANAGLSAAADSNAGLALVANHTSIAVIISDPAGRVEWCNAAFERLTGYTVPEIKGRTHEAVLHGPETDTTTAALLQRALERGEPCEVEILNYSKTGNTFWLSLDRKPVRDRHGRIIRFISIATDITERRQARQTLQTLNHRLELATRAAALGVWEWDETQQKFLWDQRMIGIHGLDGGFGGTFDEWTRDLHPDDRSRIIEIFQSVRAGATEIEHSFRIVLPQSRAVRHVEARGIAERDAAGRLLRITGTCRDVTGERESSLQAGALTERLKLALSSSNYGVWEFDLPSQKIAWDDRMFEIYGVRREGFDGSRAVWEARLHPEDRKAATDITRRVMAGEVPRYDTSFRIVLDDGSIRHIEAHGYLQRDHRGAALRLVGLNRDITAERHTLEALKIAEERWQLALEGTNDAAWDWDVANGKMFNDERWAKMLGYEPREIDSTLAGRHALIHPDDLPASTEAVARHFAGQSPFYSQELRVRTKDNQWRWILDRGKVVSRDRDGKPLRMAGTHTDITERKILEQRLQRMEDLASQVSQLAQIGGWELETESGTLSWSRVVKELFGFPEDHVPTLETMIGIFAPEAQVSLQAALQASRASGSPFDLELSATSAKGRRLWVRVLGKPLIQNRQTFSIQGAIQDITARRESEETRHQLELQLFQAQKMETLGTFAGGIAHDFNNLLTGIIGYHELAADSLPPDHPAQSSLAEARNASLRARELVEQILTFGRQNSDTVHGPIDLAAVVEEARRFLRATLPASIDIVTDLAEEHLHVLADATQIHQVVLNLGSNAAHAMRAEGGKIKIVLRREELGADQGARLGGVSAGKYVRLSVTDTGHGMQAATLRRIFEPFFTTKNTREGTGLGLAVVHGIVRGHRGAITVESELGVGTTFHIHLPAAQEENSAEPSLPSSMPQGTGEVIWVIDDEEIVGTCTKLALDSKGYRAVHLASAAECLSALERGGGPFDLLLTDQTMPGMQGTNLALAVRRRLPGVPTVIMSGHFSKIPADELNQLGPVELLTKPFTTEELIASVDRALRPRAATLPV